MNTHLKTLALSWERLLIRKGNLNPVLRRWPYLPAGVALYFANQAQLIRITELQILLLAVAYAILVEVCLLAQRTAQLHQRLNALALASTTEQDESSEFLSPYIDTAENLASALQLIQISDLMLTESGSELGSEANHLNDFAIQKLEKTRDLLQRELLSDQCRLLDFLAQNLPRKSFQIHLDRMQDSLHDRMLLWHPPDHDSFESVEGFRKSWRSCCSDQINFMKNLEQALNSIDEMIELRRGTIPEKRNSPSKTVALGAAVNGIIAFSCAVVCAMKFQCKYGYFIMPFYAFSCGIVMGYDALFNRRIDNLKKEK